MKMDRKRFGRTASHVSALCISTSNFARYANQEESYLILDEFHESGGNLFQTTGICPGAYRGDGFFGLPEELLGRWLRQRRVPRESIVIATRLSPTRPVIGGLNAYGELIRRCASDSIRRLGCGHLDLLVLEWTGTDMPVGEMIAALDAVVKSGEIRHVVPANLPTRRALEMLEPSRLEARSIAGLAIEYSLASRTTFDSATGKLCGDHGLGVIARSPLGGGHLTGRRLAAGSGALRTRGPIDANAAAAAAVVRPALAATARARRCSPAQVALAWVLAHPQVTSVLVSVRSVVQLRELVGATRLRLADTDFARLGGPPSAATTARSHSHPSSPLLP